ncbi:hypothetical protein CHCC20375_3846 [Bacillus licheniformis]|nr:hypothetical protein CHCC20375_3846 [Bacillus licheniformis]
MNPQRGQRPVGVQLAEFMDQGADRYPVGNDVMHVNQQQMALPRFLHKSGAEKRRFLKAERTDKVFSRRQLHELKRDNVMDALDRLAICPGFKRRPERFVAADQLPENLIKPGAVERTCQLKRRRHIVADTAVFQLLKHIHPLLR